MQELKERTIKANNIVQTGSYFRYVNHADKLATTGFRREEMLIYYSDCIRFDAGTLEIMKARYQELGLNPSPSS